MALIPTFGTGLFIGAGQALAAGGPASLLGSYVLVFLLSYCLTTAIAEIAAHRPALNGTMVAHSYEYGSNHLGFSLGYLRWYSLAMMVPFEITTAMVNLSLWTPEPSMAIRIAMVAVLILLFNMLPQRAFQRTETVFTGLKIITTAGLTICSLFLAIRGIPGTPIRGFRYWHEPGPMNEYLIPGGGGRFLGFLQCFLYSVISFTLTPEITVQRSERSNTEGGPSILSMARTDSGYLFALYILSAFMMTFVSPFDEPRLTNYGTGAGSSPFVVGFVRAGIPALRILVTVLIFLSSVASGRSFLYISSRTLYTLAESGHAPAMLTRCNRYQVPYVAILTSALFSLFAFLSLAESSSALFNSLMYFITTSGSISWLCSSIIYLRFRRKTEEQGFIRVHQSRIQPYGVYVGILGCTLLPIANALVLAFPPPSSEELPVQSWSQLRMRNAIPVYLGILSFLSLYFGHQARTSILQRKLKSEDGTTSRRSWWRMFGPERDGPSTSVPVSSPPGP
ncbi:PHD finger and SET domain protein [Aspergillus costaricaensis CBS 115574]|uniref:PHD finger and SET domain protein n=1 Tax=Aspergillus costaricaensis CBS 115574 TaxID=1448317 RepID=A0ACD1IQP6_9EURO|nr:PHD finger and SET domain protein [Aspergillus costaricaensis CBS 115574]RAK93025.1 PHD finger and SET domain protein [Aspergillus costaricaensis CBS 115574]